MAVTNQFLYYKNDIEGVAEETLENMIELLNDGFEYCELLCVICNIAKYFISFGLFTLF